MRITEIKRTLLDAVVAPCGKDVVGVLGDRVGAVKRLVAQPESNVVAHDNVGIWSQSGPRQK